MAGNKVYPTPERIAKGDVQTGGDVTFVIDKIEWLAKRNLLGKGSQGRRRYEAACHYRELYVICEESRETWSKTRWEAFLLGFQIVSTHDAHEDYLRWLISKKFKYTWLKNNVKDKCFFGRSGLEVLDAVCGKGADLKSLETNNSKLFAQRQTGRILCNTLDIVADLLRLY